MTRASYLWIGSVAILLWAAFAQARIFPWDDYGPACQWMRLRGSIERPTNFPESQSLLLTVTYRLPEQKNPTTLLTNAPIQKDHFLFVLSGFEQDIAGVIFVPPLFFFSDRIEFRYFVSSTDHRWASEWKDIVYHPERVKKNGQVLCQTALDLEPLRLQER